MKKWVIFTVRNKSIRDICVTGSKLPAWPSVWSIRSRAGCWKSQATPGRRVEMALSGCAPIHSACCTNHQPYMMPASGAQGILLLSNNLLFLPSFLSFLIGFYFPPTNFHLEFLLSSLFSISFFFLHYIPSSSHDSWHHQPACNLGQLLVALEQAQ